LPWNFKQMYILVFRNVPNSCTMHVLCHKVDTFRIYLQANLRLIIRIEKCCRLQVNKFDRNLFCGFLYRAFRLGTHTPFHLNLNVIRKRKSQ
jgi:hypothetical protein